MWNCICVDRFIVQECESICCYGAKMFNMYVSDIVWPDDFLGFVYFIACLTSEWLMVIWVVGKLCIFLVLRC